MADPLLDMANAVQSGKAVSTSAPGASASAGDPLLDMANSVMSAKDKGAAPAAPAPTATQDPQWKTPGSVTMGIGDVIKGGVQSLVHGGAWLADKVAPDSQFAKDINAAIPQVDQTIHAQAQQYAQDRSASGQSGFDGGRAVGNVIGAAPLAAVGGGGVVGGVVSGGMSGLLQPVENVNGDYAQQKLGQVGTSAAVGGVANPLVSAVGRAISPTIGAAQRTLLDAGVPLTPGQILGGAAARTEAKLTSIPVLGDFIKNAQQRSVQGFNRATYDQVLAPLGHTYEGPVGTEAVHAVQQTINHAYDNALSRMTFNARDPGFQTDVGNLAGLAQNLPQAQQQQFANILQTQVFGKLGPQGMMDGPTLQGAQSELGRISRGLQGDPSFDNRQLGQAIGEIRTAMTRSLGSNNPADAVQDLANANAAYANFVRLRSAASGQGAMNNGGVFTGAQLNNAVRANDQSVGRGATATGNALMQDFSSAGHEVLGSKYPDSGTPGRSLLAMAGPAALGQMAAPTYVGPLAAAIGLGSLPYTAMGGQAAQALLTARPAAAVPVRNALLRYGVPIAAPASNALLRALTGQ